MLQKERPFSTVASTAENCPVPTARIGPTVIAQPMMIEARPSTANASTMNTFELCGLPYRITEYSMNVAKKSVISMHGPNNRCSSTSTTNAKALI